MEPVHSSRNLIGQPEIEKSQSKTILVQYTTSVSSLSGCCQWENMDDLVEHDACEASTFVIGSYLGVEKPNMLLRSK
jgi:hypothetical protein